MQSEKLYMKDQTGQESFFSAVVILFFFGKSLIAPAKNLSTLLCVYLSIYGNCSDKLSSMVARLHEFKYST